MNFRESWKMSFLVLLFLAIVVGLAAAYYTGHLDAYIAEAQRKMRH